MAGGLYGGGTTVYKPKKASDPGGGLDPVNPNAGGPGPLGNAHRNGPPTKAGGNAKPSGTSNPGGTGPPGAAAGTGIGLLAVAGLGAVALANTPVGPIIIAALVAAVIWNGQQLVTVIGSKASTTGAVVSPASWQPAG